MKAIGCRAPTWFLIVTIILAIWGSMMVFLYFMQLGLSEDQIARLPPNLRELYLAIPSWVVASGAIGVTAGLLGLVGLLLRRKWSLPVFIVGAIGVLMRDAWFVVDGRIWHSASVAGISLSILALVIFLSQVWLAKLGASRGWLR